eukprot:3941325-Rhodomonas_salina.2
MNLDSRDLSSVCVCVRARAPWETHPVTCARAQEEGKEGDSQGIGTVRCALLRAFMTHARNECGGVCVCVCGPRAANRDL